MGRINNYANDIVDSGDKFIGTSSAGLTKNFTIQDVADYLGNINAGGVSGQLSFVYYNNSFDGSLIRPVGSMTINTTDLTTSFSTITTIKVSKYQFGASFAHTNFLAELVGYKVRLASLKNPDEYGLFTVSAVDQDVVETEFYDITMAFVSGNGSITHEAHYSIASAEPTSSADKTFVHDQGIPSTSWVIPHNLTKFTSVTVVNSAGSVVVGEIIFNSINQVTINFSSAFSGKVYFN
jgi:hypothetical protein